MKGFQKEKKKEETSRSHFGVQSTKIRDSSKIYPIFNHIPFPVFLFVTRKWFKIILKMILKFKMAVLFITI